MSHRVVRYALMTFLVLVGAVCPSAVRAQRPTPDELPQHLTVSSSYEVSVNGKPLRVYESTKATNHGTNDITRMSLTGFDLNGRAVVRVMPRRDFRTLTVRPFRAGITPEVRDGSLEFTVDQPGHLVVLADDSYESALVISANPPEEPPPVDTVEHYYGPGVHRIGHHLPLQSGDDVYLAEGAIVVGSFALEGVEDVTIRGRGMLALGEVPHQENYRVFKGDGTKRVLIEGITICDAPGWIVSFWGRNEDLSVRNVKLFGNWRYNTDGVQTGTDGLLVEDCFLQCNDDNFSLNGVCRNVEIRNNVLWNLYNGGVFMLGWATGPQFVLEHHRIHDNVILRAGGCCEYDRKAPFSMKLFGSQRVARDLEFRDIDIEDIAPFGRWIDFQAGNATDSDVSDIRFVNMRVRQSWQVAGEVHGMEDRPIEGLVFQNVQIGETLMDIPQVGGLSLINTLGTRIEGKTFADQTSLVDSPSPEATSQPTPMVSAERSLTYSEHVNTPLGKSGSNLVENPTFAEGLRGWKTTADGTGQADVVDIAADIASAPGNLVAITRRRDASVGIETDITAVLRTHGPGTYEYTAEVRGVTEPVHLKVTLIVEDAAGVQQHPSRDVLVDADAWGVAQRQQPLNWRDLKAASLRVESGYGDRQDFQIREVVLRKLGSHARPAKSSHQ